MSKIHLKWNLLAPFEELDKHKDELSVGGVYLWIFSGKPERIAYIGESMNVGERHVSHFSFLISGRYVVYPVPPEREDYLSFINDYICGRDLKVIKSDKIIYPYGYTDEHFTFSRFVSKKQYQVCRDYLQRLKFAVAKIEDNDERKSTEAILLLGIRRAYAKELKVDEKQLRGLSGRSDHTLFGRLSKYPKDNSTFTISHEGIYKDKLPTEITNITEFPFPPVKDGTSSK
ncbi:MAG: hypothetical protein HY537_01965 [Deltaproteobacteria bacterium]|nr:hypothetical protein [Deltaproteobacteria bacterium]